MPKKKATSPPRATSPDVVAIIACDQIVQQLPIGKWSLAGVFDQILVSDPTKPFRTFTVVVKFYGGSGTHKLGIRIVSPGGEHKDIGGHSIDCNSESQQGAAFAVPDTNVTHSGIAKILAMIDGVEVGIPCPIRIVHSSSATKEQHP